MSIIHKYQEYDFGNGFQTHDSILDTTPYDPEVIIIGTHNHGWSWNTSDFFYGRGMYMWPALANLFLHNSNVLIKKRQINWDTPSQLQVFEICSKSKIIFGDIVKGLKEKIKTVEEPGNKRVFVNSEYYWESYKDGPLDYMGTRGWLDDNTQAIINFVNRTKSIKHVYFTFKSGTWLVDKMNLIIENLRDDVTTGSIFTPTANGFGKNLPPPFQERVWSLTHCWVWNNLDHRISINRESYTNLNHKWLQKHGVNPNKF